MKNEELQIINSFSKISMSDYQEIFEIISNKDINPLEKEIQILGMLSGKNPDYFNYIPWEQLNELLKQIQWVYESPKANVKDEYLVNDKKYLLVRDFNKLTAGQMIDLLKYKRDETNPYQNLPYILTCILLPVKQTKKGERIEKYLETPRDILAEEFREHLSIEDANGISLFFSTFFGIASEIGKTFLEEEMKLKLTSALKTLKQDKSGKIPKKQLQKLEQKISQAF